MIPAEAILLIVIGLAIIYAIHLNMKLPPRKSRETLRREWEAAKKSKKESESIRRLYVQATAEQIKRECAS